MYFSIRYEAAIEAGQLLQKASKDVEVALQQLDGTMKSQFDYAHWENSARKEYDARYAKWTAATNDMNTMLNQAQLALSTIVDNYQQFERSTSKGWHL